MKELYCKRREDMEPLFKQMRIDLATDKYVPREFYIALSEYVNDLHPGIEIQGCVGWCKQLCSDGFLDGLDCVNADKYRMTE